jgi:hypothetical protein
MSATPPPPPPPFSSAPPPPPPPPPVPAKKSNTLLIVICVIGGIFVLIGGCVGTCTYIAAKKVKTYAEESQKNPAYAALEMAATLNPDYQIVSKDPASGKITVKNKKTGKTETIDTSEYTADNIAKSLEKMSQGVSAAAIQAQAQANANASASHSPAPAEPETSTPAQPSETKVSAAQASALKNSLKKFPAEFPVYSSGGVTTLEATQFSLGGGSTAQHSYTTSDSPEKIVSFYEEKLKASGYAVLGNESGSNENGATASITFQKPDTGSTISVKIEMEGTKSKVEVVSIMPKAQ